MKLDLSFRPLFLAAGVICILCLGLAYGLEYVKNLEPCPLCLLQRYVFWGMALICFVAFLHFPKKLGRCLYALGLSGISTLGITLAGRQVWLQHLPLDQRPPCAAGLEQLLRYHSLPEALRVTITVSGECGAIDFQILGLSLASWSLFVFIVFALLGLWVFWREKEKADLNPPLSVR